MKNWADSESRQNKKKSFRPVTKIIRFPVKEATINILNGYNENLLVEFIPIPDSVQAIPGRESTANFDAIFEAFDIPALGYSTYYVQNTGSESRSTIL